MNKNLVPNSQGAMRSEYIVLNSLLKFQPKNSTLVEEKETITLDDSDENISRLPKEDFERCNSIEIIHDTSANSVSFEN